MKTVRTEFFRGSRGNILVHEYKIHEGRNKVAKAAKKWLRIRDTYVAEIEPGQDDIVI